jgi:acetyl-CoA carboxylase biotin carboxyl carrier protein
MDLASYLIEKFIISLKKVPFRRFFFIIFRSFHAYLFQIIVKKSKMGKVSINDIYKKEIDQMKIQEIREIIKLIDQSTLDEFLYESEGTKIKLKKNEKNVVTTNVATLESSTLVAQQPVVETKQVQVSEVPKEETKEKVEIMEEDKSLHKITSPMVGTFYRSSSPDAAAYVQEGTKVSSESIVCIVEAMKLFNEIEAEVNGEIVEILVKDGQLVEYGQPLFLVKGN